MDDIFDVELETAEFQPYEEEIQTAEIESAETIPAELITGDVKNENSNRISACQH